MARQTRSPRRLRPKRAAAEQTAIKPAVPKKLGKDKSSPTPRISGGLLGD